MLQPTISLLTFTFNTYTFLVGVSLLISVGIILRDTRNRLPPARAIDVCIGAMIGGLLVARAEHVLVHWNYFASHTEEILNFKAGGLNWHGAVLGGLCGAWLAGKLRGIRLLVDSFALALPIIAFGAWRGCEAVACAYGAEVQNLSAYPDLLVWEGSDIYGLVYPRFHTQYVGMMLAVALLVLSGFLRWRKILVGRQFTLILLLFSLGMFVIGFLRGDEVPMLGFLRLDQLLDLSTPLFGVFVAHKINLRHRNAVYDETIRRER
jgi:phosphatidylglycerol---prolipoprotein diacylglyceryl transferase